MSLFKNLTVSISDIKQKLSINTDRKSSEANVSLPPRHPHTLKRIHASSSQLPVVFQGSIQSPQIHSLSSFQLISPTIIVNGEESPTQSINVPNSNCLSPNSISSTTNKNPAPLWKRRSLIRSNSKKLSIDSNQLNELDYNDRTPGADEPFTPPRKGLSHFRQNSSCSSIYFNQSHDDLLELNSPQTIDEESEQDVVYNLACELYSEVKYAEAFALFVQIAPSNSKAAYNCGNMCRDGLGVEEYIQNLRNLMIEESSQNSDAKSMPELSDSEIQIQASIRFYKQAISLSNHPRAAFNLANIYKDRQEIDEAVALYKLACKEGHERSWTKLGNIYMSQRKFLHARKCYKKGMEFGHPSAWRNMGLCYEKGLGVPRNLNLAYNFYSIASEKKAHRAQDLQIACGLKIVRQQTCAGMI